MKQVYEAPRFEVETYELDANIASNCTVVVQMGDYGGGDGQPVCDDYLDKVQKVVDPLTPQSYNVNFWENTCDCYTTAGNSGDPGFFTS